MTLLHKAHAYIAETLMIYPLTLQCGSKDSAKYDAIHNRHLVDKEGSCIKELYEVAKELAGAIIPSK